MVNEELIIKEKLIAIRQSKVLNLKMICRNAGVNYSSLLMYLSGAKRGDGRGYYMSHQKLQLLVEEINNISKEIFIDI